MQTVFETLLRLLAMLGAAFLYLTAKKQGRQEAENEANREALKNVETAKTGRDNFARNPDWAKRVRDKFRPPSP